MWMLNDFRANTLAIFFFKAGPLALITGMGMNYEELHILASNNWSHVGWPNLV